MSQLGEGGMGVVYLAEDLSLQRKVALKFLPPELTMDADAKARFVHEARAASALQHHNICTIHEVGETPDGRLFICMDWYEGQTLKEKLAGQPLSVEEAIEIARQAAAALASAHRTGMVHRDIKPANIMVTTDGVVKLLDFGLAKLTGQTKLTKTGRTVGTVSYMSPEQARGEAVDARSDIFSLGAVLYEMLTGKVPFPGDHEVAVLYGVMHSQPRAIADVNPNVRGELQDIVSRTMAKNPADRYPDVVDLQEDLDALSGGSTDSGSPRRGSSRRSRAPARAGTRRKMAVALGALILLAVAVRIAAPRLWKATRVEPARAIAVMDFRNLATSPDPTVSAGITELMNIGLIQADLVRVVSSDLLHDLHRRLFGTTRGAIEESQTIAIARKAGATIFLTGTIRESRQAMVVTWRLVDAQSGDDVHAGRVEGSDVSLAADQLITAVLPFVAQACGVTASSAPPALEALTTASPGAYQHYSAGVLALDEGHPDLGIAELERAVALDSTFALAHFRLGRAHTSYQDWSNARMHIEKAWELRSRLDIRESMRLEATRLALSGEPSHQREAVALLRAMRGRWPDDHGVLIDLVSQLSDRWHFAAALEVIEDAQRLFPDDDVINGSLLAELLGVLGRSDEAVRVARAAARRTPRDPNAWGTLGSAFLGAGQPDSAEAAFRQAITLDPEWEPECFARCAYWRGDLKQAIDIFEQILGQEGLSANRRGNLIMLSTDGLNLAPLYAEAGQYHKAREVSRDYMGKHQFSRASQLLLMMGDAQEVVDRIDGAGIKSGAWARHRGMALAMLGDARGARAAASASAESQWDGIVRVYQVLTEAEAALVDRDPGAAMDSLMVMKRLVPSLFVAPGGTFLDIRVQTALARAYRMQGRLSDAARVYETWLRRCGGHALAHYELGQIYEEMKRRADAKKEYTRFLEMWADADDGLPQLVDARERLKQL